MTNENLESQLQSLHSKVTTAEVLTSYSSAATMLCFIARLIPVVIPLIVLGEEGGFQMRRDNSKLKKLLSNDVASGALKEALGDTVEYSPWDKINPGSTVFPLTYNCTDGSGRIKAVYHRLKIELGDIEPTNESEFTDEDAYAEKQSTTPFKGQ